MCLEFSTAVGAVDSELQLIVRFPVGGPACFDDKRCATFEPQERRCKVFHLEGVAGGLCCEPASAAPALRPELRVGGCGDSHNPRFAREVQGVVQCVDTDIGKRSAAGQLRVGEPAAQGRYAGAAEPGCLRVVRAPKSAGVDDLLEGLDIAAAAVVEGNVQDASGLACRVHHGLAFDRVARDGLLAEHVDSPFQGGDRHRGVQA